MVKTKSRVNYVLYYTIDIISELFNIYIHNVKTMKIKFTNKQIVNILNESSEDHIIKAIKLLGGIHMDNIASSDMVKGIMKGDEGNAMRLKLGVNYENPDKALKVKDRIRFHEYWNRFSGTTDGRGFSFEGIFAGLFGGETTAKLNYEDPSNNEKNPKADIIIKGNHYSLKIVSDGIKRTERFKLGSYKGVFDKYKRVKYKDNENDESLKNVMTFLRSDDYSKEDKSEFLMTCFKDTNIKFIFAR